MVNIEIFDNREFGTVRTLVHDDGTPWFAARDVASVLGYEEPHKAVSRHCKKAKDFRGDEMTPSATPMKIIPETDVYRLIMRSNLPNAERFQDWVMEDVLPAIRKTGSYTTAPALPEDYATVLRALADTVEQKELAEAKIALDLPV